MPKRQEGKETPHWRKKRQNRQAGQRKVEKKGAVVGKKKKKKQAAEGTAEALAVRAAQRGHEVSEQFCSQLELELGLTRAKGLPQAPRALTQSRRRRSIWGTRKLGCRPGNGAPLRARVCVPFPPMRAWLEQPHGRRHKAPPQPCALTTSCEKAQAAHFWSF